MNIVRRRKKVIIGQIWDDKITSGDLTVKVWHKHCLRKKDIDNIHLVEQQQIYSIYVIIANVHESETNFDRNNHNIRSTRSTNSYLTKIQ